MSEARETSEGHGLPRARVRERPRAHTILLVEDNEDNRVIYETYLTHVGFLVLLATNAEVGLTIARTERPALILMDVGLPGLNGIEATHMLKHDPATRDIPVVVLTAHIEVDVRERALAAGCDAFLTKPVGFPVLVAEMQRLLAAD